MPLDTFSAKTKVTYTYWSNGTDAIYWTNTDEGIRQWNEKPLFGVGDVLECGVNLATRQIIYTKNGEHLDTASASIVRVHRARPIVRVQSCASIVRVQS
uniref:B30.2/SPRY domain-containing protein n=1 Tax=Globodera rostochiensis TaxID=31243 RepID=A0A914HU03_GLORO